MTRALPPLNALRAFEAAFRHQSFARAAAELNVAQAAVSRHVRDLEIWLGAPLFERRARGVALTLAGQRLGASLVPVFEALGAAVAAERADSAPARITVTVEPVLAQRWLLRRLMEFRTEHPEIEIVLDPTNRLVELAAEGIDLGIRYGDGPWKGVSAELLARVEVYPVASPAIAAQLPDEAGRDELRRFTLLHEDGLLWRRWFREESGADAPAPAGLMLHDTHLALEAAALGQGIALGDSVLDFDDRAAGRLVRLTRRAIDDHAYWLVTAPGRRLKPAAKLFSDWLVSTMAADMKAAAALMRPSP
ncbi:LysR substrate-binding domain-containing protein [Zavarzinia sp.]|uniref:LysR substrate-binding domain-containing protein n=1 Tax=Zavarzinia sp. TaxID=2027920 RepID=UPI0035695168